MDGILLIDKPAGMTSHDVVARGAPRAARGAHGPRGHAGPVRHRAAAACSSAGPRNRSETLMALRKRYETVAQLGATSSTGDTEGEITADRAASARSPPLPTGEMRQRPPVYSAVKIGGERAYRRARRGESVEMPERIVTVHRFAQQWRAPDEERPGLQRAGFEIECGSGTYVRSLIADLGDAYCLKSCGARRSGRSRSPTPSRRRRAARRGSDPPLIALDDALAMLSRERQARLSPVKITPPARRRAQRGPQRGGGHVRRRASRPPRGDRRLGQRCSPSTRIRCRSWRPSTRPSC